MGFGRILSSTDIAASGLAAERMRMEIAANNIANANTTSTPQGGPYRRQQLQFSTAMQNSLRSNTAAVSDGLGGVIVKSVSEDQTELPLVYNPGHPDADAEGFVRMPNVQLPIEMVDLMTAGRAYDANLKSLQMFRQMAEQALSLMSPR